MHEVFHTYAHDILELVGFAAYERFNYASYTAASQKQEKIEH